MSNDYYNHGSYPAAGAAGSSAAMRSELDAIATGFNKLPTLTANANKLIKINSGATGQTTSLLSDDGTTVTASGDIATTGNFVLTGAGKGVVFEGTTEDAYETTLVGGEPTADRTVTLPNSTCTLAGVDISNTFTTGQTIDNASYYINLSSGINTWTSSGGGLTVQATNSGVNNYGKVILQSTRSNTRNTYTISNAGDIVGHVRFQGADGSAAVSAGYIECTIDGTPGAGDMPGRIGIFTTPDGSSTPVERLRISNDGLVTTMQGNETTLSSSTTLTGAHIRVGIVVVTGTGPYTLTSDTGTNIESSGVWLNNSGFNWSLINTSSNTVTIATASGITLTGTMTIAAGASGLFRTRRSGTGSFIHYRIA